jgi:hypothetical protein
MPAVSSRHSFCVRILLDVSPLSRAAACPPLALQAARKRKFRSHKDADGTSDHEEDAPRLFEAYARGGEAPAVAGTAAVEDDGEGDGGAGDAARKAARAEADARDDGWDKEEAARDKDLAEKRAFEARLRTRDEASTRKLAGDDSRRAADRAAALSAVAAERERQMEAMRRESRHAYVDKRVAKETDLLADDIHFRETILGGELGGAERRELELDKRLLEMAKTQKEVCVFVLLSLCTHVCVCCVRRWAARVCAQWSGGVSCGGGGDTVGMG